MPEPLGFFITWTTYGTWLPGDERGWIWHGKGLQLPNQARREFAQELMTEAPFVLDDVQRGLVEETVGKHCQIREWELHVVNCRTNHVHVVVSANRDPDDVRDQLKAWGTRKLKAWDQERTGRLSHRENWWTEKGSCRFLGDEQSLAAAIVYVRDFQ